MKKPDRFEREMRLISWLPDIPDYDDQLIGEKVACAIRREHAWMVRKIRRNPLFGAHYTDWKAGYTSALQWMLDQLIQRRK